MCLSNEEQKRILELIKGYCDKTSKFNKLIRLETRNTKNYIYFGKDYCFTITPEDKELFEKLLNKKDDYGDLNYDI